ncbi:AraC family transcriptional regulator [Actinorhabdospora filicis]|uniref:AraC family transcriptional regulator n=1 Tax=Actinorhabdospora filicis TaxID=1785913 RepID=A0A9W6SLX6_9ACTN|nr:helix-turn-helix domain-containing protein [Actinorhabdospora filicis]GLZ78663.1 AraC family transcriptional regulator [Actinorhabdospora filicis]
MTETDRLARLLDAVTACLDDPGLTGEDLAARAHLSRHHFDRLATAALGEPPGAFRRRLLLERAAHTLATTDRPVTVIAFDAGYGSLEAFTRAFDRAFGRAPSRHRLARDPRFRIEAPSGIHFHPPGGVRLPATEGDPMSIVTDLIDQHVTLVGELLEKARPLSAEALDRPVPYAVDYSSGDTTLRELLAHLVGSTERWIAAMSARPAPAEGGDSISALAERYGKAGPEWRGLARTALEGGRSGETFIDATCEPARTFTYGGSVAHLLHYGTLHRCLVIGALRAEGVEGLPVSDPIHRVGAAA